MATINELKKHYDKLTAPERYALIVSANIRGDKAARAELERTAPKVTFEFSHCKGISDGFEYLTNHHIAQQLATAGTFFLLMALYRDEASIPMPAEAEETEQPTGESALSLVARRFLEGREAYEAVCQEYNLNPDALCDRYNLYPELVLAMTAVTRLGFADDTDLTDLESTTAGYREMITYCREHGAEDKARAV